MAPRRRGSGSGKSVTPNGPNQDRCDDSDHGWQEIYERSERADLQPSAPEVHAGADAHQCADDQQGLGDEQPAIRDDG